MPKVYVLNRHGRPLMPCTPVKARHLLDAGKAKVRQRTPFTIQLLNHSNLQEFLGSLCKNGPFLIFIAMLRTYQGSITNKKKVQPAVIDR